MMGPEGITGAEGVARVRRRGDEGERVQKFQAAPAVDGWAGERAGPQADEDESVLACEVAHAGAQAQTGEGDIQRVEDQHEIEKDRGRSQECPERPSCGSERTVQQPARPEQSESKQKPGNQIMHEHQPPGLEGSSEAGKGDGRSGVVQLTPEKQGRLPNGVGVTPGDRISAASCI